MLGEVLSSPKHKHHSGGEDSGDGAGHRCKVRTIDHAGEKNKVSIHSAISAGNTLSLSVPLNPNPTLPC